MLATGSAAADARAALPLSSTLPAAAAQGDAEADSEALRDADADAVPLGDVVADDVALGDAEALANHWQHAAASVAQHWMSSSASADDAT